MYARAFAVKTALLSPHSRCPTLAPPNAIRFAVRLVVFNPRTFQGERIPGTRWCFLGRAGGLSGRRIYS